MNFQLDDDLSDGSNDSFFEDPKVLSRKSSGAKTQEKKVVNDLFNILDDTEKKTKDDIFSSLDSTIKGSSLQRQKKTTFEDDDDILGTMGLDKKKPTSDTTVSKTSKKSDLLESILGPKQEDKKNISFEDILKDSKFGKKEQPRSLEGPVAAKPMEKPAQPFSLSEPFREGRRGRRPSTGLADPLGLFEPRTEDKSLELEQKTLQEPPKPVKDVSSKSVSNLTDLPDWLSGSKASKSEPVVALAPGPSVKTEIETEKPVASRVSDASAPAIPIPVPALDSNELLSTYVKGQQIAQADMEVQQTFLSLQQQESQLLVALQLKKYEDGLTDIQRQQQEVLVKQEKQFNIILDRYLSKQQLMENNMRMQQERINNHIQMLISNVPSLKAGETEETIQKKAADDSLESHEKIVESMKTRHAEEIFVLEESYKKQIFLLEHSMVKIEDRLKNEVQTLAEAHEEKLAKIKDMHEEEITSHEAKYRKLEEAHEEDIKKLKDHQARVIDDIKSEHANQLEMLKQMKDYESNLQKDGGAYSQKMEQSINLLSINAESIYKLQENMQDKFSVLTIARENSLASKEKEIELMKATLEKCRESAELERSQLLGLVQNLETKIAEQNNCSREERWALQQATSTLAARAAALDREMEFNRTSLERERDQLKTLKESMLAEQEKLILQLNEEKLAISSERSRLTTSARLNTDFDHQRSKAEIEAAIQVAKESAEMTDRERANLQRQYCEVERLKRVLMDRERKLEEREDEVQKISLEAHRKTQEAERAINESKSIEHKYKDRLKDLQVQLFSLTNREKKLSEEKIAISRERLMLYAGSRHKKKCGLCEVDGNLIEEHHEPELINVFEDELPRVRFDLNEEEKNSEVSREESNFAY